MATERRHPHLHARRDEPPSPRARRSSASLVVRRGGRRRSPRAFSRQRASRSSPPPSSPRSCRGGTAGTSARPHRGRWPASSPSSSSRMWPGGASAATASAAGRGARTCSSWIIWLPIVGRRRDPLLAAPGARRAPRASRSVVMLGDAGASRCRCCSVPMGRGFHFNQDVVWMPRFGIHYHVGVDGISLWLVLLTVFITPIAAYASFGSIQTRIEGLVLRAPAPRGRRCSARSSRSTSSSSTCSGS